METVKLQYVGVEPTFVRTEPNGAKVEVAKGEVVEVEKRMAGDLLRLYKGKWIPTEKGAVQKQVVAPEDVQGEVEEEKVVKAKAGRPKKKAE